MSSAHFSFTDDQQQYRETVSRFLERKAPVTETRRIMETEQGYDSALWGGLSEELGLVGIQLPESAGGQGFGHVELGIAMEELGRSLCCVPYFGSAVLAAEALREATAAESMALLLPPIASGARIASLALAEPGGGWAPAEVRMQAVRHGDAYRLTGIKRYVLDGLAAQDLLVVARVAGSDTEDELALFHLAADAPGVSRRALQTLDPTRRQAEITFETAGASRVSTAGDCSRALDTALDRARIALANEMVGGAQALFDRAVEYAKLRMQFGRPIGSFQAIKHKCAELLLELELAKAAAYYAAAAVDADDAALPSLASLAKATASEAYMHIAEECIQIHGGIGFTWDSDVHLWFKRAKSSEVLLGTPAFHRERYVQTLEEAVA